MQKEKMLKLTKASAKQLMNWHGGSGRMFISEGTGNSYKMCDIYFWRTKTGKFALGMGNKKVLELTDEQAEVFGEYAAEKRF